MVGYTSRQSPSTHLLDLRCLPKEGGEPVTNFPSTNTAHRLVNGGRTLMRCLDRLGGTLDHRWTALQQPTHLASSVVWAIRRSGRFGALRRGCGDGT